MGSGFRTFTAGEVLTASNVQNYLQDQVVMTFAGSAARSSAIGTANFEEGMVSYLTDTDKVEAYNGTNWVQVGSSNQGLTLINTTSFSGVASQSLPANTFTTTYSHYKITFNCTGSTANFLSGRMRTGVTDAIAGYKTQEIFLNGSSSTATRVTSGVTSFYDLYYLNTTVDGIAFCEIHYPADTKRTGCINNNLAPLDGTIEAVFRNHVLNNSTSYDSMTFFPASGTISGSISVYGYNK